MNICALCRQRKTLKDSHLIPKWVYKRLLHSESENNKHPVKVAGKAACLTSDQITQYLLCDDCEDRFSKREDYVARLTVLENGTPRILQSIVRLDTPRGVLSELGNDIDSAQIAYFASSIFWRSCVMQRGCKLGPYESQFRSYLLEETPFPPIAMLSLGILEPYAQTDNPYHGINPYVWVTEPASSRAGALRLHGFILCGLVFRCFIGQALPIMWKQKICLAGTAQRKFVSLFKPDKCEDFLNALDMLTGAKPRGKLATK